MGVTTFLERRIGHPAATGAQAPAARPRSLVAIKAYAFIAAAHPRAAHLADEGQR